MFLNPAVRAPTAVSFPRMCGDVPDAGVEMDQVGAFPRMRGDILKASPAMRKTLLNNLVNEEAYSTSPHITSFQKLRKTKFDNMFSLIFHLLV